MSFSGWLATLAGWYVTEIGRQPFIIYSLLRTADVVSTTHARTVAMTLVGYVALYLALIVAYVSVIKYMAEKSDEPTLPAGGADAARADAARGCFRLPCQGAHPVEATVWNRAFMGWRWFRWSRPG